ncbi:MAG TPA: (Fe-S)-binding protein, partial [Anaerolineales bacterium]|nr:(Fe-S)-binding protein [Anaerolineales bacterium]
MATVQLFITCLIDSFYPQTGEAVVDILQRLNVDVEFPADQTCCGQPNFNAGLRIEARPIAEHTLRVFERTVGDIVTPSGS